MSDHIPGLDNWLTTPPDDPPDCSTCDGEGNVTRKLGKRSKRLVANIKQLLRVMPPTGFREAEHLQTALLDFQLKPCPDCGGTGNATPADPEPREDYECY
jgi:hypothetical protein